MPMPNFEADLSDFIEEELFNFNDAFKRSIERTAIDMSRMYSLSREEALQRVAAGYVNAYIESIREMASGYNVPPTSLEDEFFNRRRQ